MSFIALVLVFLTFSISVFNFITIRKPENDDLVSETVTVIVPMRNEAENVAECISALSGQGSVDNLKFILVNDSSTDGTLALIKQAIVGDSRFTVIDSPELRTGWLGKVSALQAGYEAADSEFIVTIDADVRLKPKALARAINQLKDLKLDFVSPYPQQVAVTFSEKLIQPLLHWSWMSTVVLRLAEKYPIRSTAIANGQFFVVRKEALDIIEGFSTVSGLTILKLLVRSLHLALRESLPRDRLSLRRACTHHLMSCAAVMENHFGKPLVVASDHLWQSSLSLLSESFPSYSFSTVTSSALSSSSSQC